MRCKHGWLHFWVPSMQVLWPLHWQGGQLVKNHCWFGQISSVRTFRTFVTGPLKPPGMQVPVPRFEPSSHQPQAGSSWNGEEEPEVIVRSAQPIRNNSNLAFRTTTVRFACSHLCVHTCPKRYISLARCTSLFNLREIQIAAFVFVRSPLGAQAIRKGRNVSILVNTTILIWTPQTRALCTNSLGITRLSLNNKRTNVIPEYSFCNWYVSYTALHNFDLLYPPSRFYCPSKNFETLKYKKIQLEFKWRTKNLLGDSHSANCVEHNKLIINYGSRFPFQNNIFAVVSIVTCVKRIKFLYHW